MLRRRWVIALTVPLLLAAPAGAAEPDPSARGPFGTVAVPYEDGVELVGDAGEASPPGTTTAFPQAIRGELTLPAGAGPFPVVVLLHGNHGTCAVAGSEVIYPLPPCPSAPPATASVDSYTGYRDLAELLASHGYLVASIDANSANGFGYLSTDGAALTRAQIIALHLDRLAEWHQADGPGAVGAQLRGKVDLSRIGLMGHSRGGEAVSAFVRYARERQAVGIAAGPQYPGVRAVMALAPTDFGAQEPARVAWGTLLPLCDRDVADLDGARVYERTKAREEDPAFARVQFAVAGANHNWFNTVWGDDEADALGGRSDAACSPNSPASTRMSPDEQRRVGAALMGAFLRRYVGPEPALEPFVTGERGLPTSACPAAGDCDERVQISYAAAGAQRRTVLAPAAGAPYEGTGFASLAVCTALEDGTGCPAVPTRSSTAQLALAWDGPATLRIPVDGDVRGFGTLSLRAAAGFDSASRDFTVELVDLVGRRGAVGAAAFAHGALIPAPGEEERELLLGGIRIPLGRFAGVDLGALAAVELRFAGRGTLQLADVAFQEPAPPVAAGLSPGPARPGAARACRAVTVDLRRAVSRRLVRARVRAGNRTLRVTRRLRVRVPAGTRRIAVTGTLRGGRRIRRAVVLAAC